MVGAESPAHAHLHRILRIGAGGADRDAWIHAVGRQPGSRARTLQRELSTTAEVFNGLVKEARRAPGNQFRAAGERFRPETRHRHVLRSRDLQCRDAFASAARSYQSRIGVDLLWIADDQGRMLVNLPASPKGLKPQIGYSPIAESLETEDTALAIAAVDGKAVPARCGTRPRARCHRLPGPGTGD